MTSRHSVTHKRSSGSTALQPRTPYTGKKASTLVRLYWRMLPNSRITAHDCILIGEIRLQNGGSAVTKGRVHAVLSLGLGQICRLFLSFAWGNSFDRETAVGAISLCSQGTGPIPPSEVVLEADHSQQNMVDVKHIAGCPP